MKNPVCTIFLILSLATTLTAQTESKVTLKPEKPQFGDSLTVIYIPSTKSPLLKADTVLLQLQLYDIKERSYVQEYAMKHKDNEWSFSFKIDDPKIVYILFQFAGTEFKINDNNNTKAWGTKIYDNQGNPVKGAYSVEGSTYMAHGMIWRFQNMEEYNKGYLKELELFPDDPVNITNSWYIRRSIAKNHDSINVVINKEAEQLLKIYPDSLPILESAYYVFMDSDKEKAEQLNNRINELEPKKKFGLHNEWNKIVFMPNGEDRLKTFYEYYKKAKGTSYEQNGAIEYYRSMIEAKYYKQAIQFLNEWKKPSLVDVISSAGTILKSCKTELSKNKTYELDNKVDIENKNIKISEMIISTKQLLDKAISLYSKQTVNDRKKDYFPSAWKGERRRFMGLAFAYLGRADFLLKDYGSAVFNFTKSEDLTDKKMFYYPTICSEYIRSLFELKKYREAFELGIKIFEENNWNKFADIKEILLASAKELKDPKYNVKKKLDAIAEHNKVLRAEEIKGNFKARFRQAPDFSLTDLKGKEYSLTGLKGKMVILEFWNTYCGWCEKSAPYFQEFYNKHKNDKDLVILSVNCDPTPDQKDKHKFVTDFLKDKGWKFPIAIDIENKVTSKFRPGGVPVTFFIGPDSKIYYTENGFSGTTMVEDFEKIVNMIRNN